MGNSAGHAKVHYLIAVAEKDSGDLHGALDSSSKAMEIHMVHSTDKETVKAMTLAARMHAAIQSQI